MEKRIASGENGLPAPRRYPGGIAAEHLALDALRPYDAEPLPPPRQAPRRVAQEDGRLLRLALLPLASWCLGVLLDLSAEEMLYAVMAAGLVAGAIALRR